MPTRIQLRRTKGWRLPPNTVVVSRPSRWGNPFLLRQVEPLPPSPEPMWAVVSGGRVLVRWDTRELAAADAVDRFRRLLVQSGVAANRISEGGQR